ncbi:MAG: efflux RND transporter periplasmic adaptor subunit [Nitrospirae bacterium]|nr:MAG: efflux RND transporter periplasmic adaptor subunit [Nitrospirota bacterium]
MNMRLVSGCVLLAVLVGGCGEGGKTEAVQPADKNKPAGEANHAPEVRPQIVVEEVQLKPLAGDLSLPGKVQYSEDRYAKVSSPLVGRVVEVRAKLGDKVAAGQVLLSLESADLGAAYSDFVKAESDFQLSKRNYELANDLYETKAMSKKDLVQAENDFLKAQAEFRRTRERLLALRVPAEELDKPRTERLITSRFDLKSPLAGTVVERNVTVGQMVGADPTQVLYTIADLNELQVVAEVYERDLSRVSKGVAVTVTVEAYPDETFSGTIVYVGDVVDPTTRTIKVRCNVTNRDLKLKPEMFARVRLRVGSSRPVLALPKEAVIEVGGQAYVFVQAADGRYVRRPVVTGTMSGDTIQIREGLQSGERVVVKGALLLKGEMEKG